MLMNQAELKSNQALVQRFKLFYQSFGLDKLEDLSSIYTQDVEFVDPVHEIHGILGLKRYFRNQCQNLESCRFHYHSELINEDKAFVRWTMKFCHPRIAGGKTIEVPGISEIHFSHRIFYHQDCYDMGGMLYENVPLLGSVIRTLKGRLA